MLYYIEEAVRHVATRYGMLDIKVKIRGAASESCIRKLHQKVRLRTRQLRGSFISECGCAQAARRLR